MSERNVLKLDIDGLTEFQKELHYSKDPEDPTDVVNSRFKPDMDKYAWSTHTKTKMTHTHHEGEVIYTASKKFDVLFNTEMHINLIPIKVKDKFKSSIEICYPHNVGHNICYQGDLKIDDDLHQSIDSVWMDIHSQYFMKRGQGMRNHYNRMIGSLPCLEEWNIELPGLKLIVPQPFYYSRNTRVALVTLRSSKNTITHHYKIRNKIDEILRMRVKLKNGKGYKEIPCKLQYLDIQNSSNEIPIPELWARYALMTDEEREWIIEGMKNSKHTIYTEDIVMVTSNNPTPLGSTDVIPLHCKTPCKSLFWVAQDIKGIENRNFSNYSTNLDDKTKGWNPCAKIDLKYGGASRIEKLSHNHFEFSEPWNFFPSAPSEPGYNALSLGYEPSSLNSDTAIVLEPLNASLHVKLGDTNPFLSIDEPEEEFGVDGEIIPVEALDEDTLDHQSGSRYLIHVRALVYKKLIMGWNAKDNCIKYTILDDATKK